MILSSRSSKYWLLNIWTLQILNYDILLKEKIKRLYTAFTSDYPLHIWLPTSTYTLQFLHHYLWPKLSRHWYNLQKSVLACQKYIWKAFKKRIFRYHNIFEYFVKSCQTRQASTDRWYFLDILSCICSIIAVFHASNIHMDLRKAN
jgi:hypothetical protein